MSTETILADGPVAINGLPAQRRRWAAAAIFTALAMASLDTAIANIALPAIAADLHASPSEVIWVVNVYQIAMVATLLPLAALGEVVGHHRIYLRRPGCPVASFSAQRLACPALTARVLGPGPVVMSEHGVGSFVYPGACRAWFRRNHRRDRLHSARRSPQASSRWTLGWLFAINIPSGSCNSDQFEDAPRTPRATHASIFLARHGGGLPRPLLGIGSAAHHARPGLVAMNLAPPCCLAGR